jgi:hypothetical protein
LDLIELQREFIGRVESASGKPVIMQCDPKFAGHATIRIARDDQPAHLLLHKQEHDAVLPYLVAFQCLLALRTIEADKESRLDLASKPNMAADVLKLTTEHAKKNPNIPEHAIPQLATQFGNGLGWQLRSFPIAIRVDKQIHDNHPELRPLQRKNIEQQLQESMEALSPSIKKIAPKEIIDANASMSSAFTQFWADLWNEPALSTPFTAAGYKPIGEKLLALNASIADDPNKDRELIESWAKAIGIDRWFKTVAR